MDPVPGTVHSTVECPFFLAGCTAVTGSSELSGDIQQWIGDASKVQDPSVGAPPIRSTVPRNAANTGGTPFYPPASPSSQQQPAAVRLIEEHTNTHARTHREQVGVSGYAPGRMLKMAC